MKQYTVTGMSCAACQARVEKAVRQVKGVTGCQVSLLTNSMGVEGDARSEDVIRAVEQAGYGAKEKGVQKSASSRLSDEEEALKDTETPKLKRRLIWSAAFLLTLMYITMGHNMWSWPLPEYFHHNHIALALLQMLLALGVMLINRKFFTSGLKALKHFSPNMDTLVALGSGVSFAWSLYVLFRLCGMVNTGADAESVMQVYHDQLYFESAAMIPALITVGKLLEAISKGRTTGALKSLMRLSPKTATVLRDGAEVSVPIEQVQVGDLFTLRPGESVPVDGVVLEGQSAVNESALTGESIPVDKTAGDKVSAATINQSGFLKCKATRVGEDTTLSQIIKMVSDAAATKAPIARIADRVSGVFVPAVIGISLIVLAGWLIAGREMSFALERAISVLVISCPCALGLATPVAIMVGNGVGAKHGILFKTGRALETLGKVKIVALDKTGTVTRGQPAVTDIVTAENVSEDELLSCAAALEQSSEHPLAKAVMEICAQRGIKPEKTQQFRALSGHGLRAKTAGSELVGGSLSFIGALTAVSPKIAEDCKLLSEQGKTPLLFAKDGKLLGALCVADEIKPDSADAVRQLKKLGLHAVMLTGDNARTARAVAGKAGVDEVASSVLPDGKEQVIRSLQLHGRTAMVGDGINDAPALTRADSGIAIGAGTDVAVDSADIVLMNNSLSDVAAAVRLSRQTLKNIRENLFWAFFYNLICIPLAAGLFGLEMKPMYGAAAMSLSSFTVCMNALRLNLFKLKSDKKDAPLRGALPEGALLSDKYTKESEAPVSLKTLSVGGMMCPHCESTVKKALESLPFVLSASASHESGTVTLTLGAPFDEAAAQAAIEQKGYEYKGVQA